VWLTISPTLVKFNLMVELLSPLDRVFRALANEPRREILRRVARERRSVTELARHFDMSLAAVSKHIGVLAEAGLVEQTRQGRMVWCRMSPVPLEQAQASISELRGFWEAQLDGLAAYLVEEAGPGSARRRKGSASK
jgi:DNA-binding transcriptional ArsR family regulator